MLIKSVLIKNFRGYRKETIIPFEKLTAFVGKNDAGKSTVLEALDIFFNDGRGVAILDKTDINKSALADGETEIIIGVEFIDFPNEVVIDGTNTTTFKDEYLLNKEGNLFIVKKYKDAGKAKVFLRAEHPNNSKCNNLHTKQNKDLVAIVEKLELTCDKKKNAEMRRAIWANYTDDLQIAEKDVEFSNDVWLKLSSCLPTYSLFQSDRSNSDKDKEAQDPLKEAVKRILADDPQLQKKCREIAETVLGKLKEVTNATLEKLREMNKEVASTLSPQIPNVEDLKWADVFKGVSITGDDNIPINKRGSGVKRLVLLNFFRAQAENNQKERSSRGIIYAIEEPETAQHSIHQKMLIKSLKKLSENDDVQFVITTHSSLMVKMLDFSNIRLIHQIDGKGNKIVKKINENSLPYPSMNEISFLAFKEVTEDYHNELYGYIESENKLREYREFVEKRYDNHLYTYEFYDRKEEKMKTWKIILSEKVRHQIHHPESEYNNPYTEEELQKSIEYMRTFLLQRR